MKGIKNFKLKNQIIDELFNYDDLLKINKKNYRDIKIKHLKNKFMNCLHYLKEIIDDYKQLINMTEYWENGECYKFDFDSWNTIKKANGKLTRYYNDLLKICKDIRLNLTEQKKEEKK